MKLGLIAGLWVCGSTILGGLLTLLRRYLPGPERMPNMDFALGMMLAASVSSLLVPAAQESWSRGPESFIITSTIAFGGALGMYILSRVTSEGPPAFLFVIAMMLHNFPEGLAGGAALTGLSDISSGSIIFAIMVQNVPEGFATVIAFQALGLSRGKALVGGALSGLVELIGGGIGGAFVEHTQAALPGLLALAGGAMLQVTVHELKDRFILRPPGLYSRLGIGVGFVLLLTCIDRA